MVQHVDRYLHQNALQGRTPYQTHRLIPPSPDRASDGVTMDLALTVNAFHFLSRNGANPLSDYYGECPTLPPGYGPANGGLRQEHVQRLYDHLAELAEGDREAAQAAARTASVVRGTVEG